MNLPTRSHVHSESQHGRLGATSRCLSSFFWRLFSAAFVLGASFGLCLFFPFSPPDRVADDELTHIYIYHIHSEYSAALFRHVPLRDEPFLFASEMARCGALNRFDRSLTVRTVRVIVADPTRCMDDEY